MSLSNWLCNNNSSKSQFVRIVYPGGHVELHDRPVLAADIALRNPKCCVAHPHVFQKPWAIVEPETMLMLGQKYYVVPIGTVRKLQRFSLKYSPINHHHHHHDDHHDSTSSSVEEDHDHRKEGFFSDHVTYCFYWMLKLIGNNSNSKNNNCFHWRDDQMRTSSSSSCETETKGLTRKRRSTSVTLAMRASPKRFASLNQTDWEPDLESVTEE